MGIRKQEYKEIGRRSDAVRTKLINRTTKCEELSRRGQSALAQEVVQTVDLPHPIYIDSEGKIKEIGAPIAAPSANRFGSISPTSSSAVMSELSERIPMIIDSGACSEGMESTIVRVEASGKTKRNS